jgi:hypothetical protein
MRSQSKPARPALPIGSGLLAGFQGDRVGGQRAGARRGRQAGDEVVTAEACDVVNALPRLAPGSPPPPS